MKDLLFMMALITIAVLSVMVYREKRLRKESVQLLEGKKWYHIAMIDDLTKIKNRTAYALHIKEIEKKRTKGIYGLILFDVDNFKKINDTYGHMAGDKILQMVASMLEDVFSEKGYSLYRIGGDEFAVITENISEQEIIDKLLVIRQCENEQGKLRSSKGYSMFNKSERFDDAFVKADEMLYADKASKKVEKRLQQNEQTT